MDQAIPIYVINLDRHAKRWERIERRLSELDLNWTRVPALDADTPDPATFDTVIAGTGPYGPIPMLERARTASHFRLFERLLSDGVAWAVVLEDDVTISDQMPVYVRNASWVPADADIVKIEKYQPGRSRVLLGPPTGTGPDGRRLHRLHSRHAGAGGYLIGRATAQRCLADAGGLRVPIDQYLFDFSVSHRARHLVSYFLQPALVTQFASASEGERHWPDRGQNWAGALGRAAMGAAAVVPNLRHMLRDGARMRDVRWQNRTGSSD